MSTPLDDYRTQPLGEPGEVCRSCRSPLAVDQRYCLSCGARRGASRVEIDPVMTADGPEAHAVVAAEPDPAAGARTGGRDWTPVWLAGGMAALGVMLVVGVLIGRGGGGDQQPVLVAGDPAAAIAAAGTGEADAAVSPDWPEGEDGFTIELGSLPNSATAADVDAAKAELEEGGAENVGVLDSDDFASLPEGNFVLYSGVFESKADANKALKDLKADFPDAKVIKVSIGGGGGGGKDDSEDLASEAPPPDLDGLTAEEAQDALKKSPDDYATPGKPPPKDDKPPAGGGDLVEIE